MTALLLALAALSWGALPSYEPALASRADFDRLAAPWPAEKELLPRLLVLIDHLDAERVYFIDSKRHAFHLDFINEQYLSLKKGDELVHASIDSDDRSYTQAFLFARPEGLTLEFWRDDEVSARVAARAWKAVRGRLYSEPKLRLARKLSSSAPELAGIPLLELPEGAPDFLPLNPGRAVGTLIEGPAAGAPGKIVLLDELDGPLPVAEGVLVRRLSSPLSHAAILMRSMGVPGAAVSNLDHKALLGRLVILEVRPDGYSLREATAAERRELGRGAGRRRHALPSDLRSRELADLADQRGGDVVRFGAKSANLGEALNSGLAGLRVPPGFTIPFYYYASFVRRNGLGPEAARVIAAARKAAPERRRELLAGLRAAIERGEHEPELRRLVIDKLEAYRGQGLFVRSSTNSEDLPGFSGAGLYSTVPNVRDPEAVLEAVKTVWASIWSDKAFDARERFEIDHASVLPAVLIQRGISADAAGVLITADPRKPEDDAAVFIAAKTGLGGRVVDGHAAPEQLVYHPADDRVELLNASEDKAKLEFAKGGGLDEKPAKSKGRVLSDAQARELARLAAGLRGVFNGLPQDIEWVAEGGKLWIVQARPYPLPSVRH